MKRLLCCALALLSCPVAVGVGIVLVSAVSLASAYTAQYGFGLEPCILCLYQRVPFALAILLGAACAGFGRAEKSAPAAASAGLAGLAFLAGSAIAFYHTGVERHWWKSVFDACVGVPEGMDAQSLLERIESAARAVPCDEIPWADPILGLSMANYNALMSFGLFAGCALAAALIARAGKGSGLACPVVSRQDTSKGS